MINIEPRMKEHSIIVVLKIWNEKTQKVPMLIRSLSEKLPGEMKIITQKNACEENKYKRNKVKDTNQKTLDKGTLGSGR